MRETTKESIRETIREMKEFDLSKAEFPRQTMRRFYGLTLQDVADKLHVSRQMIDKFEKGIKKSKNIEAFYDDEVNFYNLRFEKYACGERLDGKEVD